jgi:selenocysteine-specific elongation factor
MNVIGTAGHVDHGKSTLVQALTGIHPDRLKEEREREMTIDLGFAWLVLPGGAEIGIVDVPGHRDFIENMLAGVGGIDAVIFVIAADEGIMPQTREHLAILDLLQISSGVIALTKIDLIDDPDWLDLVEDDIRTALFGTVLESASIIRVSARTRQGIPELLTALTECLAERPPRHDLLRPRLPVDRVFTIAGFGTVVTGTLSDGALRAGEEVHILPAGLRGRIRGLQTHKKKEEIAVPGSRTAVNISGLNIDQIKRGDVIVHPGDYQPTRRIDVRFRLLPDISHPLEHSTEVKMYLGAAEVVARVRLLGFEQLDPGQEGWLQLELSDPVVAVRGDRYILRRPSPGETLGGGVIVDPHPSKRHKRFSTETLEHLETLARGTPAEILLRNLNIFGAATLSDVIARSDLESETARQAYQELVINNQIIILDMAPVESKSIPFNPNLFVMSQIQWHQLVIRILQEVDDYHHANPLRRGLPREELKSRLKLPPRLFNSSLHRLVVSGEIEEIGPLVRRPGYEIKFTQMQERQINALLSRFAAAPFSPPTSKECINEVGDDLYGAMLELGILTPVPPDLVFRSEDYDKIVSEIRNLLNQQGTVTAAEVRDHLQTSRRYVLAILEFLDTQGITVREGDSRRLK